LVALWLALLAGFTISILTPPLTGGDERDHFTRAYQISRGSFLTHERGFAYGAYLPRTFEPEEARLAQLAYTDRDRTAFLNDLGQAAPSGPEVFTSAGNAASYGPGAYLDYAVAMAIGRLVGLSTLALLYLARFAGVLTYGLLLALAVRRLPVHKWVLVAVGVMPAALNQASTVSADGMTMVLSFLVVGEALRLSLDPDAPRTRILIESAGAAALLALAKPPYIVIIGLFAIPAWRYRRALLRPLVALGVGALGLAGAWGAYQEANSPSQSNPKFWLDVPANSYAFHGIRISAQTRYVLTHPWSFVAAAGRTFAFEGLQLPKELFGMLGLYQLSWLPVLLSVGCLSVACFAAAEGEGPRLPTSDRVGLVALALVVTLSVFAIAYTNWNQYRAPRIDAVNTRYLIPVLPALLIGLLPMRRRAPRALEWSGWRYVVVGLATVVLVVTLIGMQHFQYSRPPLKPAPTSAGSAILPAWRSVNR